MSTKPCSDARSLDHQLLQCLRQRAVAAVEQGFSVAQVAATFGLNRRTVFRWLADYRRAGPSALLAKPIPGRPKRKLEDDITPESTK